MVSYYDDVEKLYGTQYRRDCWFDLPEVEGEDDDEGSREVRITSVLDKYLTTLEQSQSQRVMDMLKLYSMYHNEDILSQDGRQGGGNLLFKMPLQICNQTQPIVDAIIAKHVVNESKPTFDVDDGDFEAHLRAKQLDRFVFGEFYRLGLYEHAELALRDAAIAGDGWLHFYKDQGKVNAARVNPIELFIDPASCASGPPQELYRVRYVARRAAMAYYPEHAEKIRKLPQTEPPYPYPGCSTSRDLVRLYEAWHLPGADGTGGLYVLGCGDVPLCVESYERQRFPFVRFAWCKSSQGGYSQGLVSQLAPQQAELNRITHRIYVSLHFYAMPRMFLQAGSQISYAELEDYPVQVGMYTGAKPELDLSPCVSQDLVRQRDILKNEMWQLAGVSPLQAGTDMPSRLDSRPGLREYVSISDEKHAMASKTWDRGILEFGWQIVELAREIVKERGSYKVMGAAKDFTTQIDWKDIDLDNERFRIKLMNANLLPTTPAGKRLAVQDLAEAGAFKNPEELWLFLRGSADVDAFLSRQTAPERLVEKQMYRIVHKREEIVPDIKYQDLQFAFTYAQRTMAELQVRTMNQDKADAAEVFDLLDNYMTSCDAQMQEMQQAQQEQAMAMQAAAGPSPGAPPGPMPEAPAGPDPQAIPPAPPMGA